MAEAVFNGLLAEESLQQQINCDSAGTSDYHLGKEADPRTLKIVARKKLHLDHLARQFSADDFDRYDYIIAMDRSNRNNILSLSRDERIARPKVFLMREFEDEAVSQDVPDPYWSEQDGFEQVYAILWKSCRNLLDYIKSQHQL
jgi:protein-tyrosine phosphatase